MSIFLDRFWGVIDCATCSQMEPALLPHRRLVAALLGANRFELHFDA
jgi:hypothetical protein